MALFKRLFDFYLQGSLHVALSVYALVRITERVLGLPHDPYVAWFGFFGTVVGYNFVKYDAIARSGKSRQVGEMPFEIRVFISLSTIAFAGACYCFLHLEPTTKWLSALCVAITALYTLPFFPNRKSARSWAGLKIYIVALCWVGVTVVMPVLNAAMPLTADFYIVCVKRFILIVVLLFIFEIIDLAWDDPHLKTVPQQIGVANTKKLGVLLMILFLILELFQLDESFPRFAASVALLGVTSAMLYFADPSRSRYYTTFWAESIPILWWAMLVLVENPW